MNHSVFATQGRRWKRLPAYVIALSVCWGIALHSDCQAVDLSYAIHKGRMYVQNHDADPIPAVVNLWFFGGVVDPMNSGLITNATIACPTGDTQPLGWDNFFEMFTTTVYFQDKSMLDTAFPAGQYFVDVAGALNQRADISLPEDAYPLPLRIANFSAGQKIQADSAFALSWTSNNATNGNDRIRVYICDSERAPVWGSRHGDYLPGDATSVIIPADLLRAGREYTGVLMYILVVWSAQGGDPAVVRDASYYASTVFPLATRPRFVGISPAESASMHLTVEARTNRPCVLEASTDFANWVGVMTNTPATWPFDFYDKNVSERQLRLYRLRVP